MAIVPVAVVVVLVSIAGVIGVFMRMEAIIRRYLANFEGEWGRIQFFL